MKFLKNAARMKHLPDFKDINPPDAVVQLKGRKTCVVATPTCPYINTLSANSFEI